MAFEWGEGRYRPKKWGIALRVTDAFRNPAKARRNYGVRYKRGGGLSFNRVHTGGYNRSWKTWKLGQQNYRQNLNGQGYVFLNRSKFFLALDRQSQIALAKLGAYGRSTMRRSFRPAKSPKTPPSPPGKPPRSRTGGLRNNTEFGIMNQSLVVGPRLLGGTNKGRTIVSSNKGKTVPSVLNYGGAMRASKSKKRKKKNIPNARRYNKSKGKKPQSKNKLERYLPRPFVQPTREVMENFALRVLKNTPLR